MDYIVHGTLIDYIDYKKLIEVQARESFKEQTFKVINVRPKRKKSREHFKRNASVNTNKCNTLTNRRKVLAKKVPR